MRFSIITITFNAELFLEETLNSVHQQTFRDFEHLIWDGGSQDSTLEIVKKFPVKIFQGKDGGISDAMNRGAQLAKGEILLHLHADDLLFHPRVLAYVDHLFKQYPHLEWLYGLTQSINSKGIPLAQSEYQPFSLKRLKKYNCISHPATFIKRELFEKEGGFDTSLKYCMDYDLWLRLAKRSHPLAFPFTLASFRQHEGSLSTRETLGVADEAYAVRNRYLKGPIERFRSYRTWKKRRENAFR